MVSAPAAARPLPAFLSLLISLFAVFTFFRNDGTGERYFPVVAGAKVTG
ncbi:hypothetical protein H7U16_26085 [Klebsiella pneumoniae]|uniref:Uncharacterized protein n=1 Tax=Klebsiella pneumoniae TaxID=573 RepID=A0A7X1HV32_KLEPN|nr:hypothetical protein [Klebsiella pneumoniae]